MKINIDSKLFEMSFGKKVLIPEGERLVKFTGVASIKDTYVLLEVADCDIPDAKTNILCGYTGNQAYMLAALIFSSKATKELGIGKEMDESDFTVPFITKMVKVLKGRSVLISFVHKAGTYTDDKGNKRDTVHVTATKVKPVGKPTTKTTEKVDEGDDSWDD